MNNQNPRFDFKKMKAPGGFHIAGWCLLLGCALMLWFSIPRVFPDTIDMARTALVIGLAGASVLIGLTCYGVGNAKTLAGIFGVACTFAMIANVASHWLMARSLNVAAVTEAEMRGEDNHRSDIADRDAKRIRETATSLGDYNKTVTAADKAAESLFKRTGVKPPAKKANSVAVDLTTLAVTSPSPTPAPTIAPTMGGTNESNQPVHYASRREVFASWVWICSLLAILDLLLPVGGVAVCLFRWEIDLNRNGVADKYETTPGK